eukprot:1558256-Amphidinium_carterae.1
MSWNTLCGIAENCTDLNTRHNNSCCSTWEIGIARSFKSHAQRQCCACTFALTSHLENIDRPGGNSRGGGRVLFRCQAWSRGSTLWRDNVLPTFQHSWLGSVCPILLGVNWLGTVRVVRSSDIPCWSMPVSRCNVR